MVRRQNEWPEVGELVLCTTSKVIQQGAFVKLDEYKGKEGFIHLSEIASKWVKNIRNFVKEDQKIVARVLRLNIKTNQIVNYSPDSNDVSSISSINITCILSDSVNNLWIGTQSGLNLFQRESDSFIRINKDLKNPYSLG